MAYLSLLRITESRRPSGLSGFIVGTSSLDAMDLFTVEAEKGVIRHPSTYHPCSLRRRLIGSFARSRRSGRLRRIGDLAFRDQLLRGLHDELVPLVARLHV